MSKTFSGPSSTGWYVGLPACRLEFQGSTKHEALNKLVEFLEDQLRAVRAEANREYLRHKREGDKP